MEPVDVDSLAEELKNHAKKLDSISAQLRNTSSLMQQVALLGEAIHLNTVWQESVNKKIASPLGFYFEVPVDYRSKQREAEKCSCGHWRIVL